MKRIPWSAAAGEQLTPTLEGYPLGDLERDIAGGALELWEFEDGTLTILERQAETLYVWAIAGESARRWASELVREAYRRGCSFIGFRTGHKGLPRLLRDLKPVRVANIGDTHFEYRIAVEGAAA